MKKTILLKTILVFICLLISQVSEACEIKAKFTYKASGNEVTFYNLSNPNKIYVWDFGNGVMSNLASPTAIYTNSVPMTYTVGLKVIDSLDASCRDSFYMNVLLPNDGNCYTHAEFYGFNDINSEYGAYVYNWTVTYRPQKTRIVWHFGDGDSSEEYHPEHVYPGPGKYRLCLTAKDSHCYSEYCDSITFDSSGRIKRFNPFTLKVIQDPRITSINQGVIANHQPLIYPNPGKGTFKIQNLSLKGIELIITDLYGKEIRHFKNIDESVQIDLTQEGSGLYMVSLRFENRVIKTLLYQKI